MEIIDIPSYLTKNDILEWINRFAQSVSDFFGNQSPSRFIDELYRTYGGYTLVFSDSTPIFEEGEPVSLDEAKARLMEQLAKHLDRAENEDGAKDLNHRIEKAQTTEELAKYASEIAKTCATGNSGDEIERNYCEIYDWIKSLLGKTLALGQSNRFYVLGEFDHVLKRIYLFEKAINPNGTNAANLLFQEVFAHEMFHAYHYFACEYASNNSNFQELCEREDYTSKVVKESLAAFFEMYYCSRYTIPTDIDSDWQKNPVYVYPYSGAKYLSLSGNRASKLFLDVFDASLLDTDKALRSLLEANMDVFYRVKNIKEMIVRTVTNKALVNAAPSAPILTLTDKEMKKLLKGMGEGWFILKYAEEYRGKQSPISLDYGKASSYASKMSHYLNCVSHHDELIKYLKRKKLAANVRADTVSSSELQDILNKL